MSEWKYIFSPPYAIMVSIGTTLPLYFKSLLRYVIPIFNYLQYLRFRKMSVSNDYCTRGNTVHNVCGVFPQVQHA